MRGKVTKAGKPILAGPLRTGRAVSGALKVFVLPNLVAAAATLVFLSTLHTIPAQAQVPDDVRSTIEGMGNVPRWVPPQREGELPAIEVPTTRTTVPPGAEEILFTPSRIVVTGATAFSDADLAALTAPYTSREVALSELYGLAAEIQTTYRQRGFLLTRALVPAQRVEGGEFRIEVIEGFFEDVFVVGDIGPSKWQVEQYVENLIDMRPVRTQDIERYLLLSNDLPGIQAVAVIRPGTSGPGAAQLVVEVERDPFEGYVSANNRGSPYAGPWAGALGLSASGFAPYGDRTEILYYRTFDGRDEVLDNNNNILINQLPMEQWYGRISYEAHLFDEGMNLLLSATQTLSHPGYTLAPLDLKTRVDRYTAEVSYPFLRTRARSIYGHASLMHSMERSTAAGTPIGRDRLTVLELGVSADIDGVLPGWLMPFDGVGDAQTHGEISIRQGLPLFGATSDDYEFKSRLEGTAQFTTVQARLERTQSVANRIDLYVAAKGQYAFDTLLSPEEFRLGGDEFGRGYNPSEISGEHGVGATVELRYNDRPGWGFLEAYEAYAFYDYGMVWNEDEGFPVRSDLASAGIGLRAEVGDNTYVDMELARTLTRIVGSRNTPEDTTRLLVRATLQF